VYHHLTQKIELLETTDPYSRALSADGGRSLLVDLNTDAALMPNGWHEDIAPAIDGASPPPYRQHGDAQCTVCSETKKVGLAAEHARCKYRFTVYASICIQLPAAVPHVI
jgi:hypothetical protein